MSRRYHEAWGKCDTCGFDVPMSKLRRHPRWGWQCTGAPGANCWDGRIDRDIRLAQRRFRENEGVRKTNAPLTNTETEGT